MRTKKKAPAMRTAAGRRFHTSVSYHTAPALSTAAEMILVAMQCPDRSDRLRAACWQRLEQTLRRHYERVTDDVL